MRVMHVVESLNRNAVENWLVRMFAHGQAKGLDLDWTFYCQLDEPGAMDDRVKALGGTVVCSPVPLADKRGFASALRQHLRAGCYDVMHAHHDILNGYYFAASVGCPLVRRICHIHNADENVPVKGPMKAAVLRALLRWVNTTMADTVVGISNHTLDRFIQGRRRNPSRHRVHYYGVDPSVFAGNETTRAAFREEIGLPETARIMLFSGRIVPEKNPRFVVDIFRELRELDTSAYLVFAGTGGLEDVVAEHCETLGLAPFVRMLGWRDDLPRIMQCSDLFVLARPEEPPEGFGLAVIEAQLAGLLLLMSRGISDDPLLPSASFRRLPLSEPPSVWAREAVALMEAMPPSREVAVAELHASPMDMDRALDDLLGLHAGKL